MPKKVRIRDGYLKNYIYNPKNQDIKTKSKQKIKTKNNKRKKPKFFIALIAIASLLIIVFLANIFAGLISPGRINLERGDKYFTGKDVYAIELNNYDNSADAFNASENYKELLAAGYVVNDAGTYRVLASAYTTKANADSVLLNLKEDNLDATIYKIQMPSLYMDLDFTKEQKNLLKECFDMFYNSYVAIYDLSIDLDKGTKTLADCKLDILSLKDDYQQIVNNFNMEVEMPKTSEVIYTKIYLNTFMDNLDELSNIDANDNSFSSKIKESYFKIIYGYINLKTELAKN